MRVLILLRGAPGCGKSTFLRENNLAQYALCADDIRLQIQTPVLGLNGHLQISQKNDKQVWDLLKDMLKKRMSRGEFTIIDATHQKAADIQDYKDLCQEHRYRCYVLDFTDVPIETCLAQNKQRPVYKHVPEKVIENAYSRFKTQQVPGWVTVVKPDDFKKTFQYKPTDYSHYEKVHIIGDVQGCYTPLAEYLNGPLNSNHLYVFLGDLLDRGIENDKVLSWVLDNYTKPNTVWLEGNHEKHIRDWANDDVIVANDFIYNTKPQLEQAGIDKKRVRELARKFVQLCFFKYGDKYVIASHGGISTLPESLLTIATEQYIKGVGRYEDDIDKLFTENTTNLIYCSDGALKTFGGPIRGEKDWSNIYQVHGHRNILGLDIKAADRSFNLEGKVEFGGHLRVVTLDQNGFQFYEIQNPVYRKRVPKLDQVGADIPLLERLRASKNVAEKQFGNISSFNFTQETMWERKWTAESLKARGLFINTNTKLIVARSYDKFFNINEVENTKIENLQQNLQFPLDVYAKYNGFLGITGYDEETDQLVIASKSTLTGDYKTWFEEILTETLGDQLEDFKVLLKQHNLSAVFEVIDPVNDPHIVEYTHRRVVLIDLIKRTEAYEKWEYRQLKGVAKSYGLDYKSHVERFEHWQEFFNWYERVKLDDTIHQEGYVIEDSAGFMTKIKLPWYNHWKLMRKVKERMAQKGNPQISGGMLTTPEANEFYGWLKSVTDKTRDIISLRKEFEAR